MRAFHLVILGLVTCSAVAVKAQGIETRYYAGTAFNPARNTPGDVQVTLRLQGERVTGDIQLKGLMGGGAIEGIRRGNNCELHTNTGATWSGTCDDTAFSGTFASGKETGSFQTKITRKVAAGGPAYDVAGARRAYSFLGPISVEITGEYPAGYAPKWQMVDTGQTFTFMLRNGGSRPGTPLSPDQGTIQLSMVDGAPSMVFRPFLGGDVVCYATLEAPASGSAKLTARPQTFKLVDFRKKPGPGVPLGATCASSSTMIRSWSGEITLSSDSPTGDVVMDMVLDNYTDRGALTFHREVHDLVLTDVMTPLIAAQTVAKQKETAIARAADERNRQIRADIDAKADALLPQMEARAERVKPIITLQGYAIQPIIDPVALSAGQPCGGDFQKLKGVVEDAWKFHADVQSRRLADYPKAAPHEKNTVVAVLYSEARAVNKRALKVAAHLAICDREGLLDADKAYLDVTFDEEEATRVMRFLNKE